ncbi:unnamed protein product [Phytophthora lilii]|uniref:Unnamed protein product n=1 Tax=Phytophthora lilii TaxID=2077276 RepID=A0A9W6TND7_9STRA|nr:unnamed protein product [Phytophthora lilii]
MSFGAPPMEDVQTIAEALAFIDSFDDAGLDHATERSRKTPGFMVGNATTGKRKNRTKKINPPGYSTRVQRGRKLELEALRREALELEMHVKRLKSIKTSSASSERNSDVSTSKWEAAVTMEYQERQRSEENNRKLKLMISHQRKVNEALRSEGIADQASYTEQSAQLENSTEVINLLENKIAEYYSESKSWDPVLSAGSVSSTVQTKHDEYRGEFVEINSTTPVPCLTELATNIAWKDLATIRDSPEKSGCCISGERRTSFVKNWNSTLQIQTATKYAQGVELFRKFQEPHRFVIVKAGLVMVKNEGLHFHDQLLIITHSKQDPRVSVVHVREQIYLDPQNKFTASNVEPSEILKHLSWKLGEDTEHLQDTLVDESENLLS